MADANTKQILNALALDPALGNKFCCDCNGMNPQWASVSFGTFICLSCAGIHRGFGVHISFVRSVSMDSWNEDQLRRMKLGGNTPCNDFLQSYTPTEAGGYSTGMSIRDKYHCHAATQYREKLAATLAGDPWSPSLPPPKPEGFDSPDRPDSSQSLRKSRAGTRSGPGRQSSYTDGERDSPSDQKASNEAYFDNLGAANASRSADLPPSQGGRYQGFGSTPTPPPGQSSHPSFGLSSASAPSLADIQADPMAALGKGWSLFSSVVAGASKVVHENVIQPGMEKVSDPNFRNGVAEYVSNTTQTANAWGKTQLGVDVGGMVSNLGVSVAGRGAGGGYSAVGSHADDEYHGGDGHDSALYSDAGNDDFFSDFNNGPSSYGGAGSGTKPAPSSAAAAKLAAVPVSVKKDEFEDEWKDF